MRRPSVSTLVDARSFLARRRRSENSSPQKASERLYGPAHHLRVPVTIFLADRIRRRVGEVARRLFQRISALAGLEVSFAIVKFDKANPVFSVSAENYDWLFIVCV